jgi:hypothetical protein
LTDDPREILKAAGVEVPELDQMLAYEWRHDLDRYFPEADVSRAILALARLISTLVWQRGEGDRQLRSAMSALAKCRWQRDEAAMRLGMDSGREADSPEKTAKQIANLDRRWEERNAT